MLELTAKYADAWNTAWFGPVDGIAESRANLEHACAKIGRDPASIEVTVGVSVDYPMPDAESGRELDPGQVLTGTPEEVAADLRAYEDGGVSHVICGALRHSTYEYGSFALDQLSEALKVFRSLH